jgi:Ca2+-binding EF-hand superfamily protein
MSKKSNEQFEATQIKVFSRWANKYVKERGLTVEDVTKDFKDGVKLINLLEIIGKEPMPGKWKAEPKNDFAKLENITLAIKYITEVKKVRLVGIGSQNILESDLNENNRKLTLGLIWSVINKFQIEDISVEEATARDALLIWCRKNTKEYSDVDITNFGSSWSSGLAFCALINHFRPEMLDYNALDKANHANNCKVAFEACTKLGITVFLDVEDVADVIPDEKSIVTQVSEFFHFFASDNKAEQMAEKLKRTVGIQKEIKDMKGTFEGAAKEALEAMEKKSQEIADDSFEKDTKGVKGKLVDVIKYGKDGRPKIFELKSTAAAAFSALQLKCKTTNRPLPPIQEGLDIESLDKRFNALDQQVVDRKTELLGQLNGKVKAYTEQAKSVQKIFEDFETQIKAIEGELEEKQKLILAKIDEIKSKKEEVDALTPIYDEIEAAEMHLEITETPSFVESIYTSTLSHANTILHEIDASIAAKQGLQISQEQIDDFRNTFTHFDKDCSKSLQYYELRACLTALGEDVSDDQAKEICKKYSVNGHDYMLFDEYVKFMLDHFSKAETADSTKDAFKAIAANNSVITAEQIDRYFTPEEAEFLKQELKQVDGGYEYESWVEGLYA